MRRIIAVTGAKAKQAFARADEVDGQVAALEAQEDPVEGEVSALKDTVDRDDVMPAPSRAAIKARVRPPPPPNPLLLHTLR